MARRAALRRLARDEGGFTLTELVTVLGMLVIVMTTLSSVLIAAAKAEEEMNRRFGSQINARIALDQLRREIHCASAVTPAGSSGSIVVCSGMGSPLTSTNCTVTFAIPRSLESSAPSRSASRQMTPLMPGIQTEAGRASDP